MRLECSLVPQLSAALTLVALAVGCGGGDVPKLGQVTGIVTFDGKPLEGATVTFEPAAGGATTSIGKTDAAGAYELFYTKDAKGATIGDHTVRITSYGSIGEGCDRKIVPEKVPARYNVRSELTAKVARGSNTFPFDLKSGGEVIQPDSEDAPARRPAGRSATGCF